MPKSFDTVFMRRSLATYCSAMSLEAEMDKVKLLHGIDSALQRLNGLKAMDVPESVIEGERNLIGKKVKAYLEY